MGARLTERTPTGVVYVGRYTKLPGIDCASSMRVAAVRECMDRLADYEETGLTPEEMLQARQAIAEAIAPTVELITAMAPQLVDAVRTALENMTTEQIIMLLQDSLQKK